jgi:hypothetical protein
MSSSTAIRGTPRRYLRHFTSISPVAIRQSPFAAVSLIAIRQSPIAVIFGSAGASPSHFSRLRPASHAPRPILFPFPVPCPAQEG